VGGAERHVTTLTARLDRGVIEPRVICIGSSGELFGQLEAAGVPGTVLGRPKAQALATIRDLVTEFRRDRPDVVVLRGFSAELLGRVAALIARVPRTVVWVHNCGDVTPRGSLRRVSDRVLEPVTDAYFGVARRQVRYLTHDLGHPEHKVRIIHNGVDLAQFDAAPDPCVRSSLGLHDGDLVVGILAALRPEKDHETFLQAAALVADEVPDARFLVVGDGERRRALTLEAEELGIGDRTVFAGARDDVQAVLSAMDVFVLSSYTVECFPMALLEAMAASRPAVCTAVGGVPEILVDGVTGRLVPPRAPEALAAALIELLRDPSARLELGAAARARVETEFSLDRSVEQAQRAIREVADGREPGPSGPVRLAVVLDETWIGGVEVLLLNLFRAFDPAIVHPVLVCLRRAGPLADEFRAAGFDVVALHRSGRFDMSTLPRLTKILRDRRIQAVLVTHHHRAALLLGQVAARRAGVAAAIVAVHDMDLTSVGKRCLPRWAVARLHLASALVLLADSQADYLHREEGVGRRPWSRTREVVIPNGIPLPPPPGPFDRVRARSALGLPEDSFVVGIVARLSAQKAHQVLLEAFASLVRTHPEAHLVVVGEGDRRDELQELATALGIERRVHFTGRRRDVQSLLPGFDVGCLSSVHEGAPLFVIEAMAAALPVVATDCGALRDMVQDGATGRIVPVNDSAALASALGALADEPGLRSRMGRAARLRAEQDFQVEQTAVRYETLLTELAGKVPTQG
jgi:glycosyltransferase involved in cell wall biosynthesis